NLIDSVTSFPTQVYTDPNANANTNRAFYFVILNQTNGSTVVSDTIQSVRLNVVNTGSGYASLIWNTTHQPVVASNSFYYRIYREFPAGSWTLVDSIDIRNVSPNYLDEI